MEFHETLHLVSPQYKLVSIILGESDKQVPKFLDFKLNEQQQNKSIIQKEVDMIPFSFSDFENALKYSGHFFS